MPVRKKILRYNRNSTVSESGVWESLGEFAPENKIIILNNNYGDCLSDD